MFNLTKVFSKDNSKQDNPYKIGFVLGGGGARGFAHLGMMEALSEKGIRPDIISGVSAGAVIGSFICAGYSPTEAFSIIREYDFISLSRIRFPSTGLLKLDSMSEMIKKEIKYKRLEDLPIPLIVTTTNLSKGRVRYFKEGNLPKIIQATSSIPVLFIPTEIDGDLFCDGGVYNNMPYGQLKGLSEKTVGLSISPVEKSKELKGIIQVASRAFQLSINANTAKAKNKVDLFIEPKGLREFDVLDGDSSVEIFEMGYKYAKKELEKMDLSEFVS